MFCIICLRQLTKDLRFAELANPGDLEAKFCVVDFLSLVYLFIN